MKRYYPSNGDALPSHGEYVLAYFPDRPWEDSRRIGPPLYKYKVVRFQIGISHAERVIMTDDLERKRQWRSQDEGGNNHRPYNWSEFGPGSYFGQECLFWCHLPDPEAP